MTEDLIKLETTNTILQNKIQEWETALEPFCCNNNGRVPTVDDVVSLIAEFQKNKVSLTQKNSELARNSKQYENKLIISQKKCMKAEEEKKILQEELKSAQLEKKSTCKIEDNESKHKIEQLENTLTSSKQKLIESEAMVLCLERKNKQILKLLEKTEKEASHMEHKLARGEYNPRDTKVLHIAINPEKMARKQVKLAKMKELTNEIEYLRKQIFLLKKNGHGKLPLTVRPTGLNKENYKKPALSVRPKEADKENFIIHNDDNNSEKIRKLETEMNQERVKMDRMKRIWHQKVTEFREACYELTGYKIDMKNEHQFVLRPMYAERESDHLLFRRSKKGFLQVMETDFCKTLEPSTLEILSQKNSIPAFISQITIDLFSQMTQY